MDHKRKRTFWTIGIGLLLMIAGGLMLTNNLGITDVGSVWSWWPVLLVTVGIGHWVDATTSDERRRAFFWLFIGAWMVCSTQHVFGLSFHNSWPILLIGFGISTIWRSFPFVDSTRLSSEADHAC
jgi:hypothetical protein